MKLSLDIPSDGFSSIHIKSGNTDRLLLSNEKSFGSKDQPFNNVRERLSSTRHLLEQTLNKKNSAGFSNFEENNLHKELKKTLNSDILPNFPKKSFLSQPSQIDTAGIEKRRKKLERYLAHIFNDPAYHNEKNFSWLGIQENFRLI